MHIHKSGLHQPLLYAAPTTTATPTPVTTDDDDDSNTGRNVGIGVGVGVGGALLILLIVLLIVFLCIRYRRGKRHSKYVLNYNTVYGKDTGTQGPNAYCIMS